MTRATSTRENTRANTAPPVKASGQKASLLTANAPNADERLQRQRRRHTSLRCHLLPTELKRLLTETDYLQPKTRAVEACKQLY